MNRAHRCVSAGEFAVALLLVFSISEATEWYDAYDRGVKAVQTGQWSIAEENLKEAKALNPEQGKRVKGGGDSYLKYIPDYYLGVVYYNQRKYQEAVAHFELAESLGLVQQGDSEFIRMTAFLQSARQKAPASGKVVVNEKQKEFDTLMAQANEALAVKEYARARDLAKKAAALGIQQQRTKDLLSQIDLSENAAIKEKEQAQQRQFASLVDQSRKALDAGQYDQARDFANQAAVLGVDPQKATDLLNSIDRAESEARTDQRLAEFNSLMAQANQALKARQYSRARALAVKAKSTGVDPGRVFDFIKSLDWAEQETIVEAAIKNSDWIQAQASLASLEKLDPEDHRIAGYRARIELGLSSQNADQLEEVALQAFYTGRYEESITLLERVLKQDKDSVVAHFYLGCSHATIGLLGDEKEGPELLMKARTHFAAAQRLQPGFIPDSTYISPGILQIYKTAK